MDNEIVPALLLDRDQHFIAVIKALREVHSSRICVFQSTCNNVLVQANYWTGEVVAALKADQGGFGNRGGNLPPSQRILEFDRRSVVYKKGSQVSA
ncbi:hypothetical protein CRG98_023595 [Punica granatum]|uniref:Uncharacterized protein n=1 Tax=Punica granatum TaxID=22663 RepID=A0A2I0JIC1_PUNGR|nr:hypothetical protein CRG98_023595 [Punica granatum]